MLPLLVVSGVYGMVRVQQETRARVEDERERAAATARTIQIAVESSLAVRGRPHAELVDLLDDLTLGQTAIDRIRVFDRTGQVLAASNPRTAALPPSGETVARVIEQGTGDIIESHAGDKDSWVYILPVRYSAPWGA